MSRTVMSLDRKPLSPRLACAAQNTLMAGALTDEVFKACGRPKSQKASDSSAASISASTSANARSCTALMSLSNRDSGEPEYRPVSSDITNQRRTQLSILGLLPRSRLSLRYSTYAQFSALNETIIELST